MDFSEVKRTSLKPQKELKLSTFLLALLCAAAIFAPFVVMGNGYFTYLGDFNAQQISFYRMCHNAIRNGNFGWSFTTDLGSNFIGSYSFYLFGSPFFWLTIPFPSSMVPYLMAPLLVLKIACSAFTSYLYIRRFTRTPQSARLGALLYAFSGFSIYNIFYNHFHEAIIVLPLLLLAIELLITENKRGLVVLMVAICAIINYYFFFGMVVFCVLYYFVRLLMGEYKFKFSRLFWLFFESLVGVIMAMAILLPSILAITGNSRLTNILFGWNTLTYTSEQRYLNIIQCFFFPPDLPAIAVFFPESNARWQSLAGWLPLFGMTGVIAWFVAKKKTWIKRILVISAFMAMVPILNSLYSALNASYYARWFYMPVLIMCLATALACEDKSVNLFDGIKWTAPITVVTALAIGLIPNENKEGKLVIGLYTEAGNKLKFAEFWGPVLVAVGCLVMLAVHYFKLKDNRKKFIRLSTVFVCIVAVFYGGVYIYHGKMYGDPTSKFVSATIENKVELDGDKYTYRIDTYDCKENLAMYMETPGIHAFHSTVSGTIMDFYNYLGIERSVASRPGVEYPALRSLLSVKYLLDEKDSGNDFLDDNGATLMPGYKYLKTSDNYYVYENENYIGYGFSYDYAMSVKFLKDYDGDGRLRMMLKGLLLTDDQLQKYSDYFVGELDSLRGTTDVIKGDAESTATVSNDTPSLDISDEAMSDDCKRLAATSAKSFKVSTKDDKFTAVVERDKKSLVFFSIPYDNGWTATVNGQPVEIENVCIGFMAVPVDAGTSTIEFTYTTPGLYMGILISLIGMFIFGIYAITSNLVIQRRGKKTEYPEGERLIAEWSEYERTEEEVESPDIEDENEDDSLLSGLNNFGETNDTADEDKQQLSGGFVIDESLFDDKK